MKKYLISIVFLFGFASNAVALSPTADGFLNGQCVVASLCGSETVNPVREIDLQQILQALRENPSWLDSLLKKIRETPKPSRPEWCYNFEKNMGVGDRGEQVKALRKAIGDDDQDNDLFDEKLASKIVQFQEKNKDEILKPLGLSRGSGYLGASTRKWLNRYHACAPKPYPPIGNQPPVISGVSGPTVLNVGQTGTWTVQASDPENGNLSYSVHWGDELDNYPQASNAQPPTSATQQTSTFTHSYAAAMMHYPTFTVTDSSGQVARTSISVRVGDVPANPSIIVTSPNGGENWVARSVQPISWTWTPNPMASYSGYPKVDLYLASPPCVYDPCFSVAFPGYVLDKNIPMNAGSATYNWIVATDIVNNTIPSGQYLMRICPAGSTTGCDLSDNYFTITSGTNQSPSITVLSPNGGENWAIGSRRIIKWRASGFPTGAMMTIGLKSENGSGGYLSIPSPGPTVTPEGQYEFTLPADIALGGGDILTRLSPGQYKITLGIYDRRGCLGYCPPDPLGPPKLLVSDLSDNYFTITSGQ